MSLDYEVYKEGGILNNRYQKIEDISEGSYGYVSLAKDIEKKKLVAVKYIYKLDKGDERDGDDAAEQDEDVGGSSDAGSSTSSCEKRVLMAKHRKLAISSEVKSRLSENICFESAYEIEIQTKIGNGHKNIVNLLDFFDSYIVLEYCSGGDLYEAIKNDLIPRKTKQITHILTQIIDAIQFVHSKGIYHRDIKPENILISNLFDWTIKLSDWGLATCNQKSLDRNVGSERYMAPELFESNLDIAERKEPYHCDKVDVWSIGVVFLNTVFSKNPFSVANQSDKSFCYFAANREALFDVFSTMSLDFFQVLRYSLTIDPTNRDLEKMRLELENLSEYTLDDEYYNSLHDDEVAISDEESHPTPAYIPPSSAPMPVSLPTPMSSSVGKSAKRMQPSNSSTPKDAVDVGDTKVATPDISSTPSAINSTNDKPEERQRARSVPKFKFRKRSHPPKNSSPNNYQNNGHYNNGGKPIKNNNHSFNFNHHYNNNSLINNNNNQKNSYFYGEKPKIIKHSRKPLGIPTPNTHINTYFHDYQKHRQDLGPLSNDSFNTKDFFTPPSVNNRYMEGIFSHNPKQNSKHHYFPTSESKSNNIRRPSSGNRLTVQRTKQNSSFDAQGLVLSHHSPGKYIPPNARNYFTGHHINVPDISTVLSVPTDYGVHSNSDLANEKSDSNGCVDLDDVLFTLEENEHDLPLSDIHKLSLHEPPIGSSGPSLGETTGSDLPDLLKSPEPVKLNLTASGNSYADKLLDGGATKKDQPSLGQARKSITSEPKSKPGVYVPPHHRKSSTSPTSSSEATLSVNKNSYNYSTSLSSKYPPASAKHPVANYQAPFLPSLKNHSTTTTALQSKDVFAHTDNDAILFSEDESDMEDSPDGKTMFGPYEIHSSNQVPYSKFLAGRKSSTLQDEALGSLEQCKNNWLMLQQQQD